MLFRFVNLPMSTFLFKSYIGLSVLFRFVCLLIFLLGEDACTVLHARFLRKIAPRETDFRSAACERGSTKRYTSHF